MGSLERVCLPALGIDEEARFYLFGIFEIDVAYVKG